MSVTTNSQVTGVGSLTPNTGSTIVAAPTNNIITDTKNINAAINAAGVGGVIVFPGFLTNPYLYNGILPLVSNQRMLCNGAQIKQPDQITNTFSAALTVPIVAQGSVGGSSAVTASMNSVSGFFVGMFVTLQDNSNLSNFSAGSRPTFSTTGPLITNINIAQITAINGITIPYYVATGAGTVTVQFTTEPASEVSPSFGFQAKSVSVLSSSYSEVQLPFTSTSGSTNASTAHITLGAANICICPGMSATSSNGVGVGAGQIPANTTVIAASGTDVTLSANTGSAAGGLTFTFGASHTFPANSASSVMSSLTQLLDTFPSTSRIGIKDLEFNGNSANNPVGVRWELSPFISSSLSVVEDFYSVNFPGDGLLISGRHSCARNVIIQAPAGGGMHKSSMQFTTTDSNFSNQSVLGFEEASLQNITVNSPGMDGSAYNGHLNGNSAQVSSANYQVFYNAIQCSNNERDDIIDNYNIQNDYGSVMCCGIGHINYNGNIRLRYNCGEIRGMTNGAFNILNNTGTGLNPYDTTISNTDVYNCGPQNAPAQQASGGFTTFQRNQNSVIGGSSGSIPLANRVTLENVNLQNSPLNIQGALGITLKGTKHTVTDAQYSSSIITEQCSGPVVGSDVTYVDVVTEEPIGNPGGVRSGWAAQYAAQQYIAGGSVTVASGLVTDPQVTQIQISSAVFTLGSPNLTSVTVPSNANYAYSNITTGMLLTGPGIPDGTTISAIAGASGTGTITMSNNAGLSGTFACLAGIQKLVHVRGSITQKGGNIHTQVNSGTTSGAKVDLNIKSVNPYSQSILHKNFAFRCKYRIDTQITEGFTPALGTVLCDFGQDNSNAVTGYGNVDVDINMDVCINANGWGVFGVRLPANSLLASRFKGVIRGYSTLGATGQLFKPLLYPASVATTGSKNEFDGLRIGSTRAADQAFAVNSTDVGVPNVLGTPVIPVAAVNTAGAGVGGSATVATGSTDNNMQLTVVTAGTPGGSSVVCTIPFGQQYGQVPFLTITPANAAANSLLGTTSNVLFTTTAATITVTSGTLGLTTATTYVWNISAGDISRNNK